MTQLRHLSHPQDPGVTVLSDSTQSSITSAKAALTDAQNCIVSKSYEFPSYALAISLNGDQNDEDDYGGQILR